MLADPKKGQVVPFRQSKLTSLLKESLGGNSKTALIAALSPAQDNVEETLSTCQFASRAKSIKTSARVNLDEGSRMLAELKAENERIKAEIARIGSGGASASASGRIVMAFERDKVDLQKMFKAMDYNQNGEISYEEFTEFVTQAKAHEIMGSSGSGRRASTSAMSEFGEVLSIFMTHEDHPFETLDEDGSGTISWEELEHWVAQQAAKEVDPEAEVERLKILLSQREAAAEAITMDPEELRKVSQEAEEKARVKVQEEISKQISELKLEVLGRHSFFAFVCILAAD